MPQLRDPTMNAHPRVVVEEAIKTTVARARVVVKAVVEPARIKDKKSGAGRGKKSFCGGKAPRGD